MTEGKTRVRLKVLAFGFVLIFAAIATRLWFLQVLAAEEYHNLAEENQVELVPIDPIRGLILDREGQVLVANRGSTILTVERSAIDGDQGAVLRRLAALLEVPVADLEERLASRRYSPFEPVPVAEDVPEETVLYIREHARLFQGVDYHQAALRSYPQGSLAAHILGYVGEVSEDQLETTPFEDYRSGDTVGRAGVESVYERLLFGNRGQRVLRVNAQGDVIDREFGIDPARPGYNLVLSLDVETQRLAERSLQLGIDLANRTFDEASEKLLEASAGAVVVMDPRNGQVLALASFPTYDPDLFVGGLSDRERREHLTEGLPEFNRAIQGTYPGGSTFKPFVAAGALRQRFAAVDQFYECPPSYIAPGDTSRTVFNNWEPVHRGFITLEESLVISCDTVYYQFGWDYWVEYFRSGKTDEVMQEDLRRMGFGHPTGIDLPGEVSGRIPSDEYKAELISNNRDIFGEDEQEIWLPGDYINMSIGQGLSSITPLQLAVGYSAIANGGRLYQPHVGLRVEDSNGGLVRRIEPVVEGRLPNSPQTLAFIRDALRGVPERGTAAGAFRGFPLDQIPVAGKTGTAEVRPHQDYSWFAAMAPADDPEYVVVALIEQGGHGSTTAAPVVRRILEGLYGLPMAGRLEDGGVSD